MFQQWQVDLHHQRLLPQTSLTIVGMRSSRPPGPCSSLYQAPSSLSPSSTRWSAASYSTDNPRTSSVFTIVLYAAFVSFKNTSCMTLEFCSWARVSMQFMIRSCESSSIGTAENLDCPTRIIEVMMRIA